MMWSWLKRLFARPQPKHYDVAPGTRVWNTKDRSVWLYDGAEWRPEESFAMAEELNTEMVQKWFERRLRGKLECPACHFRISDVASVCWEPGSKTIEVYCDYCGHVMSFQRSKVERAAVL